MFPTGGNRIQREDRILPRVLGRVRIVLKLVVFAMDVMLPPLNTEYDQKHAGAGYLSRNSADKCAAGEVGAQEVDSQGIDPTLGIALFNQLDRSENTRGIDQNGNAT